MYERTVLNSDGGEIAILRLQQKSDMFGVQFTVVIEQPKFTDSIDLSRDHDDDSALQELENRTEEFCRSGCRVEHA
jgi:hypothetical protein